jgi:hypothetical protein
MTPRQALKTLADSMPEEKWGEDEDEAFAVLDALLTRLESGTP